jgi:branched-chain amino acid transport system substrate-binding protein
LTAAAVASTLTVGSLALAACGGSSSDSSDSGEKTLVLFSSLPFQGASRVQSQDILNGQKLAIREAGGRVGDFKVKLASADNSTAQSAGWDPAATAANARKAAQDSSVIAYLGEQNGGATAISLPILNEAGLANVSPNSSVGLTTDEPGSQPGEPEKYYPTGKRTFIRIAPRDSTQGAALAQLMKESGCTAVYVLNDKEVFGGGLARNIVAAAPKVGVEVIGDDGIDKTEANFRSLAARVKDAGADCVVYSGITANGAVQLMKDLAAELPDAKLFASDGSAEAAFIDPAQGGMPAEVGSRVQLTFASVAPKDLPPAGRAFYDAFKRDYGKSDPAPYAIYGYEEAKLVLDAIERAGAKGDDRQAVLDQMLATKDRQSSLGTYDIDANGDTTLTTFGVYGIKDGKLVYIRPVKT